MTSVHGTATGRIFMLGQNKHVYELGYGPASSTSFWTSSTATLKCHTEGQFWAWVPMVAASTGVVKSITVDAQRQRLYTLGMNGEIGLVDVSGTDWVGKGEYNDIKRQGGEVAMLAVIGGEESRSTCLVAICVNGELTQGCHLNQDRLTQQAHEYISNTSIEADLVRLPSIHTLSQILSDSPTNPSIPPALYSASSSAKMPALQQISSSPFAMPDVNPLYARTRAITSNLSIKIGYSRNPYPVRFGLS